MLVVQLTFSQSLHVLAQDQISRYLPVVFIFREPFVADGMVLHSGIVEIRDDDL